jgi:hypothetical protein
VAKNLEKISKIIDTIELVRVEENGIYPSYIEGE